MKKTTNLVRYDQTAKPFTHSNWKYSPIGTSALKLFVLAIFIIFWHDLPWPSWIPAIVNGFLLFCCWILAILIGIRTLWIIFFVHKGLKKEVEDAVGKALGSRDLRTKEKRTRFVIVKHPELIEADDDIVQTRGKILADRERLKYFERNAKKHFSEICQMWEEDFIRLRLAKDYYDKWQFEALLKDYGVNDFDWPNKFYVHFDKYPSEYVHEVENIKKSYLQPAVYRWVEGTIIGILSGCIVSGIIFP